MLVLLVAASLAIVLSEALAAGRGQFSLVLSHELTLEAAPHKDATRPEAENGLVLVPMRELGLRMPDPDSSSQVATLTAIVVFLVAVIGALLGLSLMTRSMRERREERSARFRARWEPVLYGRMAGDAVPLPPLAREERVMFFSLWLHALGYVRDEAVDALIALAQELDLPRHLLRLLESRSPSERLLAMRVAAALRLTEAVVTLQRKAAQRRRHSSLEATAALLKINPELGFVALRELLAHSDWSPSVVAGMLRAASADVPRTFGAILADLPPGGAKQVVRLIELLENHAAVPMLRERLRDNRDDAEIAVILHALGKLGGAAERTTALAFVAHRSWLVRMQAAAALGMLGLPEDGDALEPLLRDPEWWVRYRGAQALLKLRGAAALRRLRSGAVDRFAREILDRTLAEG